MGICELCTSFIRSFAALAALNAKTDVKLSEENEKGESEIETKADNVDLFNSNEPKKLRLENGSGDAKSLCSVCLGISDPAFLDKVIGDVSQNFDKDGFKGLTSFNLHFYVPPSVSFRAEIFAKSLQAEEFNSDAFIQSLRTHVLQRISTEFAAKRSLFLQHSAAFTIVLECFNRAVDWCDADYLKENFSKQFIKPKKHRRKFAHGKMPSENSSFADNASFHRKVSSFCSALMDGSQVCDFVNAKSEVRTETEYRVSFQRDELVLGGRYNKYSRKVLHAYMARTSDEEKLPEISSEQLICEPAKEAFRAESYRFTSVGREDVDVRMLGEGRPFVICLKNPRNSFEFVNLSELETAINGGADGNVAVNSLQKMSRSQFHYVKAVGDLERKKTYIALCASANPIDPEKVRRLCANAPYEIEQRTPVRVMSSRSLSTRKRIISELSAEMQGGNSFLLTVTSQSGTYIKELVHGDFGRTRPSIAELLQIPDLDITQLDVLKVDFPWPIAQEDISRYEASRKGSKENANGNDEEEDGSDVDQI